jgi:hypothetical protein
MYGQRPGAYAQIMTTPASVPGGSPVSLDSVSEAVAAAAAANEATLNKELAALGSLKGMGVADMIQAQYDRANYTMAGQKLAQVMKDAADTMKAVIQKIG